MKAQATHQPGEGAGAQAQEHLWSEAELHPILFAVRPISRVDDGTPQDRAAFVRMIAQHGDYFQANDLWGLPMELAKLSGWLDGRSRVLVAAFGDDGACVGFCGADKSWTQFGAMEVWYGTAPSAQGRGLARALLAQAVRAFTKRFHATSSIRLACRAENIASQRVAAALGLERNGSDDYTAALGVGAPRRRYLAFGADVAELLLAKESPADPGRVHARAVGAPERTPDESIFNVPCHAPFSDAHAAQHQRPRP